MAWEKRGSQKVYYRSKRVNGHVTKIYYGTGCTARRAYEEDLRQKEAKERERAIRKEIEALNLQTDSLARTTRTIANAHLVVAGYHQHNRGEWRKRRIHNITHEGDTIMVPQIQRQEKLSIDDLQSLVQKAMGGDESAFPAIIHFLDQCPDVWQQVSYVTKRVETAWIQTIAQQDLLGAQVLERQVTALKTTLKAGASSPLEDLIIESIATTWLAYKQAELAAAEQLQRYGNALTQAQENHLSSCLKRHLSAIKELARIRQLVIPRNTTVVNIADKQQVNLG